MTCKNNIPLKNCRKLVALCCATGLTALSASSCGVIELRDSTVETDAALASNAPLLTQAERKNEVVVNDEEETTAKSAKTEDDLNSVVKVVLTGEAVFDRRVVANAEKLAADGSDSTYSFLPMFSNVYTLVSGATFAIGACSTPVVSDYGETTGEGAPKKALESLKSLGFDAINVSGSHMFALGDDGIENSLQRYRDVELMSFGIYADAEDYNDVRILEAGDIRLALLSVSANKTAENSDYIVPGFEDEKALIQWIEYADFISDVVLVATDWSDLAGDVVGEEQRRLAQLMAEAGADIIFGGGGAFQDVEYIDTNDGTVTLCAYSLGNLLSCESDTSGSGALGGILSFEITVGAGMISIENTKVIPVCTYCSDEYANVQVLPLSSYRAALAAEENADIGAAEILQDAFEARVPASLRN